jgi:hypothetical protein
MRPGNTASRTLTAAPNSAFELWGKNVHDDDAAGLDLRCHTSSS